MSDRQHIYWESGSCSSPGVCQPAGAWVSNQDGSVNQALVGVTGPALAPDGTRLVSEDSSPDNQNKLVFAAPDGSNSRSYSLPGSLLADYAWSPQGDTVAAVESMVSGYSGKSSGNRNFLVDARTLSISEYAQSKLMNSKVLWSPDGYYLFWLGTYPDKTGFQIGGSLVNRRSKQITDLSNAIGQSSENYITVTNADWLPLP